MAFFKKKIGEDFLTGAMKNISDAFAKLKIIESNWANYGKNDWKIQGTGLRAVVDRFTSDFATIKKHVEKKSRVYRLYDQTSRILQRIMKTMKQGETKFVSDDDKQEITNDIETLKEGLDQLREDLDHELSWVRRG